MSNYEDLKAALLGNVSEDDEGRPKISRQTYEETLPEGWTMDKVKQIEHHNASFRAAGTSVLGSRALDLLVGDPSKDYVDTIVEFGSSSSLRNRVHRNLHLGKGENRRDQFGHSTPVIHQGDDPELLDAINDIAERGKSLFGKK